MHIFRWLMTHPIITAWILAALAILLNLNMGVKNGHEEPQHAGAQQASHEVVGEAKPENTTTVTDSSASSQSEMGAHDTSTTQIENAEQAVTNQTAVAQDQGASLEASTVISANEQTTNGLVNSVQTTNNAPTTNSAQTTNSVQTNGGSAASNTQPNQNMSDGLSSMETGDLVQLAREAFWQNKKDISVALYKALIQREPDSLAHKGELANVYWHLNKQKESATLYAEIAEPMINAGKTNEVANMLGFIGVYFPEKAKVLQRLISQ